MRNEALRLREIIILYIESSYSRRAHFQQNYQHSQGDTENIDNAKAHSMVKLDRASRQAHVRRALPGAAREINLSL